MQAVRLVDVRRFDQVEVSVREPGEGEVRVRTTAVAICGSDLVGYQGTHPKIRPPTILGHEFAGVVEETGAGVDSVRPGDRVAVDPTYGCGQCRYCLAGRWNICPGYTNMGRSEANPGGLAGAVVVRADHVYPLPAHVPDDVGAVAQPLCVALHAARDRGRIEAGETILVFGAGAIGLGVLLAAKAAGTRAIVVDVLGYRLAMARDLGADIAVNPKTEDLEAVVREATDGYGADATFEAIGGSSQELFAQALGLTARGGRLVVIGLKTPSVALDVASLKWGEKAVLGSQAHPHTFPEVIARISDGSFPAAKLITHRFDWNHIPEAFALLENRADDVMKIVLVR